MWADLSFVLGKGQTVVKQLFSSGQILQGPIARAKLLSYK